MKKSLFKTARFLVFAVALGQLALSQVHIGIITKVFIPASGIFLFLFITAGVVMAFNSSSFSHGSRTFIFIGGCVAVTVSGLIYLYILMLDIRSESLLTFDEAKVSIFYSAGAILVYWVGTVVMLLNRNYDG